MFHFYRTQILRAATLALLLMAHRPTWAEDRKPWLKEEHFQGAPAGMKLTSWGQSQFYKPPQDALLGPNTVRSIVQGEWEDHKTKPTRSARLEVRYYPRPGDAKKVFDHMMEDKGQRKSLASAMAHEGTRMISAVANEFRLDNLSYMTGLKTYMGLRIVRKGHYVIKIDSMGDSFAGDENFLAAFDALEQCAYGAVRKAGGTLEGDVVVRLEHFHPFADNIPENRQGGDIVATVTDAKGKPLAGRQVVFLVGAYDPLRKYLHLNTDPDGDADDNHEFLPPDVDPRNFRAATTDPNGHAVINYIHTLCSLYYGSLAEALTKVPKVRGTVRAVVLDKTLHEGWKNNKRCTTVGSASVRLEFTCIARVTGVGSLNTDVKPVPTVRIKRVRAGGPDIRDVPSAKPPVELQKGDEVRLRELDAVTIEWLSGYWMRAHSKNAFLKESEYASVTICPENAGVLRWLDSFVMSKETAFGVAGVGVAIGVGNPPAGTLYGAAAGVFYLVWAAAGEQLEPLSIELHSKIIVDFDEQLNVYTLEGSAKLRRSGNAAAIDVTAGHMATVPRAGRVPPPRPFTRAQLSPELAAFAKSLGASKPAPPPARDPAGPAGRSDPADPSDDSGSGLYVLVVIIIIAAVAALAAAIFVVIRKAQRA